MQQGRKYRRCHTIRDSIYAGFAIRVDDSYPETKIRVFSPFYISDPSVILPNEIIPDTSHSCHEKAHLGKKIESFKAPNWLPVHRGKQFTLQRIKNLKKRDLLILKLRQKRNKNNH